MQGGDPARDPEVVAKMSRLLAEGANMLSDTCPQDGLPLFKLKSGDVVCPVHGKVWIVETEEEALEAEVEYVIGRLSHTAARRIRELMDSGSPDEILSWLRIIEAVERIKSMRKGR